MTRDAIRRVVGYVRVSTDEQGRSGLGLEAQREAIERSCAGRGWELVGIFEDVGTGATMRHRPALGAATAQLKARTADALVVAKLDRASRSAVDFGHLLKQAKREDWALVALDFDLDTSTPTGKLVAGIMINVAEWERDIIAERTSAALQAKAARGERLGRARQIADDVRLRAVALRAEGWSYQRIGADLGLGWTTIRRLCQQTAP